ncbi:hypothetical protein B484DRAFT_395604 [Ochromonadaceae sp. CCMP2298]|nr:hypothetical protein B484DRAFT_395604 [Ochromonadaceae sp. CCMP2298]
MEELDMDLDDEFSLPDESWLCGWEDNEEDNEEDEMKVTEGMEQQREQEEIKRQSHHRVTDLWATTWGRMLQNPQLNLVAECVEVNLFKQKRPGKIPIEFKVLIGLRILGRDSCADDLDEALNIGGSTINNIFKLFITGTGIVSQW